MRKISVPRSKSSQKDPQKPFLQVVREYVEAIGIAIVLALFIRTFVVQAFKIPSGSMIPTLLVGDHILVNKFIYGIRIPFTHIRLFDFRHPERGEVIVFKYPPDPDKDFIKRVVAVPGDTIEFRKNAVFVNGTRVEDFQEESVVVNGKPYPLTFLGEYDYDQWSDYAKRCSPDKANRYEERIGERKHEVIYSKLNHPWSLPHPLPRKIPEGYYFVMGDNRNNSSDSREWGLVPMENVLGKALVIYYSWGKCGKGYRQLRRFGSVIR
ncbi:MAG: signal peptidase I [Deltaproteobacteria bacterium]|nr:MAG: signal peptidase I [Deltaproteobacteria bacterium]